MGREGHLMHRWIFHERICHYKREGGFQQSYLPGFFIAVISWQFLPEPVWLPRWPGCCCHLNFGLDPFTLSAFTVCACYSCQWIWNDSHSGFNSVVILCVTFGSASRCLFWLLHILTVFHRHGCSFRAWWFRLIALTWPWERRPLGCSAILSLGLFLHRHCSHFQWHPLHQILCLLNLVFFDGPEA